MKQIYMLGVILAASLSLNAQSTRTVLLEVSESTWTENNSTIICAKEDVKSQFDNDELAVISYHWDNIQNGGDPLFQQFADEWAQSFNVSVWGRGAIDRTSYNGLTMTSLAEDVWADTIAARINRPTDGKVTLPEVLYDPNTDELFIRVNLEFTDSSQGIVNREMRFFCYLVQDGVAADQVVDVANMGNCSLFPPAYDTVEINTIIYLYKKDFLHNDVAISNPSGVAGTDNIITQQVQIGNQFNKVYTLSKPSGVALNDIRVVAFVANYDNGDIEKNELINAAQSEDWTEYDSSNESDPNHPDNVNNINSQYHPDNWPTGITTVKKVDPKIKVSPNPVSGLGIIEFTVPSRSEISVDILDFNGKLVQSIYTQTLAEGKQKAAFNASGIANGVYLVRVASTDFVSQEVLVIAK